jgi:hypothetical protein
MDNDLEYLKRFIVATLQAQPVIKPLEEMIQERTSMAGVRREEVFTREFLCPTIAKFFYDTTRSQSGLSDEAIRSGLGTEGFQNCPGYGFTPARRGKHLFTKSDIIKNTPPKSWMIASSATLSAFQACPDFAISKKLPFSVVGEVKYYRSGTPVSAVKELYNAARQAIFYLGAFRGTYDSAMIVIADASKEHSFFGGMELVRPELIERFGTETGIHLVPIKLN